jgi:outer membrane protein OmpA-like peptidoglycan-associated protein
MMLITEFNGRGLRARFLLLITAMLAAALWVAEASATAVVIGDTVCFSRDSSALSPEGQETLRGQAQWLKENPL